jgi:acyl-CoA thioester hydrolase
LSAPAAHHVELRWNDLDALGHVGHTATLVYLEEGRDAFLRGHGIGREEYVVGRCAVSYRNEIEPRLDSVVVECGVRELGRSSVTTSERVLDPAGRLLVEAEFVLVLWDPAERRARPITESERSSLAGAGEESE